MSLILTIYIIMYLIFNKFSYKFYKLLKILFFYSLLKFYLFLYNLCHYISKIVLKLLKNLQYKISIIYYNFC